ncbi:MAG: helix-turn-helix domain-containing protein [Spirochaetes bacterium]|nr:helix-turn-helix domain-containing protein [Spirochaetota bacterium]
MQADRPRESAHIDPSSDHRVFPESSMALLGLADLGIFALGHAVLRKRFEIYRERASYHVGFYTLAGEGWIEGGGKRERLLPGNVTLTATGAGHRYGSSRTWEKIWFHLRPGERWQAPVAGEGWIHRKAHALEGVRRLVEGLFWEENFGLESRPAALRAYGELLRLYLLREWGRQGEGRRHETQLALSELFGRVEREPGRRWTMNDLVPLFPRPVSANHLYKLCVKHHGMPPLRRITQLKMRRAEELLRQTRYPIDRIAALMGYASPFAFSAAFKRETGSSPSLARERAERRA